MEDGREVAAQDSASDLIFMLAVASTVSDSLSSTGFENENNENGRQIRELCPRRAWQDASLEAEHANSPDSHGKSD